MKKSFLIFVPVVAASLAVPSIMYVSADNTIPTIIDEDTFYDSYTINETLEIPAVSTSYFRKSDGQITKANYGEITFPDGQVRNPGNYILSLAGNYTIKYLDSAGESFTKDFVVNKYVHEPGKDVKVNYSETLPKCGQPGLSVDLVSGSALKLNKVVDLNSFKDGRIDVFNVFPYFRTSVDDAPKASYFTVKMLDAYDESRFIEIYLWCGTGEPGPYYGGAGASTQNLTGIENNPNKPERNNINYEGVALFKHTVTRYQSSDAYGNWTQCQKDADVLKIGGLKGVINYNNGKVFTNDDVFLTDLDAPEIYSKNVIDLKSFFTTGEVIPQIECFGFAASSMNVEITSLLGLTGSDLKNAVVEDKTTPTFETDIPSDTITISKGSKFYIPTDIQVNDINYYGNLKTSVYYNYGQDDQITIESGEYFIPDRLGKYTLVYTAVDGYNNQGTYCLTLNCVDKAPFTYEKVQIEKLEGAKENLIPFLNVTSPNTGLKVKAYAIDSTGNRQELASDAEGYVLIPFYIGGYKIVYEIQDDFYFETFEYIVLCEDKNNIYFDSMPPVYPYYMKGAEYSLEDFKGVKASSYGPQTITTEPYVKFDGGEYVKLENKNKFAITGSTKLQFKFVNGDYFKESDEIQIVDTKFGQRTLYRNYSTYFQGNYTSATDTSAIDPGTGKYPSKMTYQFDSSGEMDFINLISASNFVFDFACNIQATNNLVVQLVDYVDNNNYISVAFDKKDGANYVLSVVQNDSEELLNESVTYYSESDITSFKIKIGDNKIFLIGEGNKTIASFDLYLRFELTKLLVQNSGPLNITVNALNNVSFAGSNSMFEGVPEVGLSTNSATINLGSNYVLNPCVASSVLSPVLKENMKLTVTLPDGTYAKDTNGVELKNVDANNKYYLILDKAGQYRASYEICAYGSNAKGSVLLNSKDGSTDTSSVLNVDDTVLPVVKFDNDATLTIKKGDKIKIRSYTASDNVTGNDKLVCKILVTDDHYSVLENGYNVDEYAFLKKGTYYVVAFVIDEAGNQAFASYTVVVED